MKISACIITYNQVNYIEECIVGALSQIVDGGYEIVIGDDKSTDGTTEVCKKYSEKYPDKIRLIERSTNLGMAANWFETLNECDGKFIAICEGDDYWADSSKLQKQINYLESNEKYSICFHKVKVIYENGIVPFLPDINSDTPHITSIFDLIKGNYIHTPSIVFKNHKDFPKWLLDAYPCDWPLHILTSTYGDIILIEEEMACYRVHYGGIHSTTGGQIEKTLATYKDLCGELELRGLIKESLLANKLYNNWFATFYGLKDGELYKHNRFRKSFIIFRQGSFKLKFLFWLPLLFNNTSNKAYNVILNIYSKFKIKA